MTSQYERAFCGLAAVLISVLWGGYVTTLLWWWFVVPLGVTPIEIAHACGISTVVSLFMSYRGIYNLNADEGFPRWALIFSIAHPATALLFGFVFKTFM